MIRRVLSLTLAPPESPTADLYFMNACADFLGAGVARLGPTVFASASTRLVMLHDLGAAAATGRRTVYFVDDAVEAGVADASLPFLYRQKLRLVERAAARRCAPHAAAVVVGSEALTARFAPVVGAQVLHPYWSEPLAGQDHFAPLG